MLWFIFSAEVKASFRSFNFDSSSPREHYNLLALCNCVRQCVFAFPMASKTSILQWKSRLPVPGLISSKMNEEGLMYQEEIAK